MLNYLICDKVETDPKIIQRDSRWIDEMIKYIQKKGLEDKLVEAKPGDYIFIVSDKLRDGTTICQSFDCTDDHQGKLVAIVMNSGIVIVHSVSMEFCFEE